MRNTILLVQQRMISGIVIIVAVLVISTILITLAYILSGKAGKTFLVEYATVITGVSVILVLASFAYQYIDGENDEKETRIRDRISLTSEAMIDIEREFNTNYPYLQRLYSQIYPSIPTVPVIIDNKVREENIEIHMVQILLRHMQSIFSFNGGLQTVWEETDPIWLKNFRMWFSSPIVRDIWERSRDLYPDDMNVFIEKQIIPSIEQ